MAVGLNIYAMKLKKRGEDEWAEFKEGGPFDALAIFRAYFQSRKGVQIHYGIQNPDTLEWSDPRVMLLQPPKYDKAKRRIYGVFEVGEAGTVRPIWDVSEHKIVGQLKKTQAPVEPFFFDLRFEDSAKVGLLMVQTTGTMGIKTQLENDIRVYFSGLDDKEPDYVMNVLPLVDATALKSFSTGGVMTDVILLNNGKSTTSRKRMQRYAVGDVPMDDGDTVELRMHKRNGFPRKVFNTLLAGVTAKSDPKNDIRAPSAGASSEEVKIRVRQPSGKTRTFSLTKPNESQCRWDISEDIEIGGDGHPTLQSLADAADKVYEEVRTILASAS